MKNSIVLRKAQARGGFDFGWLDTRHTFSFGEYNDPSWMGFSDLRVINEDRVQPGKGFGMHGHRDMEIVSWVLEGAIEHQDSLGNGEILRPGEIQRMSAGTGIRHSEFNPSASEPLHFLQIWILPATKADEPGYEQKTVPAEALRDGFCLVAGPESGSHTVAIAQDAKIFAARPGLGMHLSKDIPAGRCAWIQVTRGRVRVGEFELMAGDGAGIVGTHTVVLEALEPAEFLWFDLRTEEKQ